MRDTASSRKPTVGLGWVRGAAESPCPLAPSSSSTMGCLPCLSRASPSGGPVLPEQTQEGKESRKDGGRGQVGGRETPPGQPPGHLCQTPDPLTGVMGPALPWWPLLSRGNPTSSLGRGLPDVARKGVCLGPAGDSRQTPGIGALSSLRKLCRGPRGSPPAPELWLDFPEWPSGRAVGPCLA